MSGGDGTRVLRVREIETREVVREVDVSFKGESQVEKVLRGMLRQTNADRFFIEDSADDPD